MKILLCLLFILSVYLPLSAQQIRKVKIGEVEEYIKKTDHPLVISFWATWCAPCVEEIPYLQESVKKAFAKKVELILISLDFASFYPKKVADFISKKKFKARFFWLDETNADEFCPRIDEKWSGSIPATLFINPQTNYRKFFETQLTPEQVEENIKLLTR